MIYATLILVIVAIGLAYPINFYRAFHRPVESGLSLQPKKGWKIDLYWLPNPINHPTTSSCYTGIGIVKEVYDDGSFDMSYGENGEGGTLLVGKSYKYILLKGN